MDYRQVLRHNPVLAVLDDLIEKRHSVGFGLTTGSAGEGKLIGPAEGIFETR